MVFAHGAGVGGNQTSQMLARINADVLAYSAQLVIVQGGGNDVVNGRTAAAIEADLASIWTALTNAGRKIIATTILPTTSIDTGPEQAVITAVNAWIRANYASWPGAFLCDWSAAMTLGNEWTPKPGYTDDGVHPNSTGWAAMGPVLGAAVALAVPAI